MIDWADLRFVLAVARSGSALQAAHALGVNQTTVTRRMAELESAVGADLFERKRSGYHMTPLGQRVAAVAARIEDEVKALESTIRAERRAVSGSVRVTTPETLANLLVTPWLRTFRKEHPGILVELIADDRRLDLARGEADVARKRRRGSAARGRHRGAAALSRALERVLQPLLRR